MPEANAHPISVHLTAADPKRSIKFYEKLGFELSECWPNKRNLLRASVQLDGQTVTVGKAIAAGEKEKGVSKEETRLRKKDLKAFKKRHHGVGVQIYLRVSDVDRHFKDTRRRKIELVSPLQTLVRGLRQYSIDDPDGYRLVFYSPAPAEPTRTLEPRGRRQPNREQPSDAPVEEVSASSAEASLRFE